MPNVSGNWQFETNSDDCSYIWIDTPLDKLYAGANVNNTGGNAVVKNGRPHGMETRTGSINLTAGKTYVIAILFGEQGGGYECYITFTPPGGSETSNGSGLFFTDPPAPSDMSIAVYGQTTGAPK